MNFTVKSEYDGIKQKHGMMCNIMLHIIHVRRFASLLEISEDATKLCCFELRENTSTSEKAFG